MPCQQCRPSATTILRQVASSVKAFTCQAAFGPIQAAQASRSLNQPYMSSSLRTDPGCAGRSLTTRPTRSSGVLNGRCTRCWSTQPIQTHTPKPSTNPPPTATQQPFPATVLSQQLRPAWQCVARQWLHVHANSTALADQETTPATPLLLDADLRTAWRLTNQLRNARAITGSPRVHHQQPPPRYYT